MERGLTLENYNFYFADLECCYVIYVFMRVLFCNLLVCRTNLAKIHFDFKLLKYIQSYLIQV